jgi:Predicted transcriptional regulator
MIGIRVDELLKIRKRTFYWLAKETGISHTTLWRLKKGKALGLNFDTLEKICQALECQPGDVLELKQIGTNGKRATTAAKKTARRRKTSDIASLKTP